MNERIWHCAKEPPKQYSLCKDKKLVSESYFLQPFLVYIQFRGKKAVSL